MHAMDMRYFLIMSNKNFDLKLDRFTCCLIRAKRRWNLDILEVYHQRFETPYNQDESRVALELRIYSISEHPSNLEAAHKTIASYLNNEMDTDKFICEDLSLLERPLSQEAYYFWKTKYSNPDMPYQPYHEEPIAVEPNFREADKAAAKDADRLADENENNNNDNGDDDDDYILPPFPVNDEFTEAASGLEALDGMTGLGNIKTTVKGILATEKLNLRRQQQNLPRLSSSRHMCFMGAPGTAKTTVARLLARIFYENGIIKNNAFVECGRGDLVGRYIGQTALKVKKRFEQAEGGILFIDEAYSLVSGSKNDFGSEAISTIVQEMENKRDSIIVIFAGYPDKMEEFLEENEGLRSRISYTLSFEDYSSEELLSIFTHMAEAKKLTCDAAVNEAVVKIIKQAKMQKNFGNGRFVRSLLEQACGNMALRLDGSERYTKEDLCQLQASDFQGLYKKPAPKQEKTISFKLK